MTEHPWLGRLPPVSKMARFIFVGGLTALAYLVLITTLRKFVGLSRPSASFIAYALVLPGNFLLHKYWTFRSTAANHIQSVGGYSLLVAGGALLNGGLQFFTAGYSGAAYAAVHVALLFTIVSANYLIMNRYVFSK